MDLSVALAFAGVAAMLIALPGPDWAFVLTAGLVDRAVLPAVSGLIVGYALLTVLVAAGLGPLVSTTPAALTVLTFAGAGYLIYLGAGTLRAAGRSGPPTADPRSATDPSVARFVRRGIGVSALNPKGVLFFVAFLPQFARPASPWPLPAQLAVLGAIWILIIAAFYPTLGFTADRVLASRPGLTRWVTRTSAVAMIVLGAALVVDQLR